MSWDGLPLVPGCNGLEVPFGVAGIKWLYCWQPDVNKHCYLNLDSGYAVWDREFHPVHFPSHCKKITYHHPMMNSEPLPVDHAESLYW